ncbi:unnamed protein product [Urochloa humidicola]
MAALMDLDLNCSPPSPEPAAQDDLRCSMLRQQLTFRDQVKDLHSLYWSRNNPMDAHAPPFRNHHSSDALPYAHHPSRMVGLGATQHPGVFHHCHDLGKQAPQCHDEATWENLDVKASIIRKPSQSSVQGRSGHRCLIDLEKPATLDDDVEIVSSTAFTNYANHNVGLLHSSQSVLHESSSLMRDQSCSAPYVTSGSTDSSYPLDSPSPVREKNKDAVSGRMCIDLNVAQEDDSNICPEPSIVLCSLVASSATRHSGDFSNNSSKTFLKGSESSIESSKGSSITEVTTISPPYSSREVMAEGVRDTTQSHKPLHVEASKYNPLPIKNIHHQHAHHMVSGLDSQGCLEIPRTAFSVCSNGENNSSLGLPKLGGTNLMEQPDIVVHRECQEETITVISDDEVEDFDLNVSVESIDYPSKNEVRQNVPSAECATIRDRHMDESGDGEDVQSPGCGIAADRCIFILETPQGRDYASPRLRSSSNGVSVLPEAVSVREVGEDEKSAAMAADTLVSIFAANSAWMTDSHGSNSQTDGEDGRHGPVPSLNSFEESILSLEETRDDGESMRVRPPDKDGPSCGIKLKRGRGLRDFQREILPGLVSLARHEICDDLHAIGYEVRKTRSRRSFGDGVTPATRTRLSRRCSTAWHRSA